MGAITDLWKSERGLIAVVLVIAATVLASLSKMTFDDWQSYTMWIFGIYAGGKTVTGAVELMKGTARVVDAPAAPTPAVGPKP